jgi:predicted transcriptional regulator
MNERPRLRPGERLPSVQKFASAMVDEIVGSWMGQPAQTITTAQSERAQLAREQRKLENDRQALIEREMELGQQIDDAYGFDVDDDVDDDVTETVDLVEPLPDDQVDTAKAAYDEAVLAAMDPAQRALFEGSR